MRLLLALFLFLPSALPAIESSRQVATNPFGAFTLGMDARSPAELVGLMQKLGYDGLMAHTWGRVRSRGSAPTRMFPRFSAENFESMQSFGRPKPATISTPTGSRP